MKKDIWLKPGKELNTGAIIGGIGFAIACNIPIYPVYDRHIVLSQNGRRT